MPDSIYRSAEDRAEVARWCQARIGSSDVDHGSRFVETSAGPTHLLEAGPRDAPAIVFVPGTNFNAATSLPDVSVLAERSTVLVPDVPGQPGLSHVQRPSRDRVEAWGRWLDDVIEHIGRPVTVVGHSLGAGIALAASSPLIRARALVCPAGFIRLKTPLRILGPSSAWAIRPSSRSSARLLRSMTGRPGWDPSSGLVEWMTLAGRASRTSLAPPPLSRTEIVAATRTPTWVGAGVDDPFLPHEYVSRHVATYGLETTALDQGHLLTTDTVRLVTAWTEAVRDPG